MSKRKGGDIRHYFGAKKRETGGEVVSEQTEGRQDESEQAGPSRNKVRYYITPDQPLKTKNNRRMDKVNKEEAENQNGESIQLANLQPVEEPCDEPVTSLGCTSPLTRSQQGSAPVPRNPLNKQEEKPHEAHSIRWRWGDKKFRICNKARTVEESLKGCSQFREIARKNKNKELVIIRDGKAISSHFPCSLIKNEVLTVKYVKAVRRQKQLVNGSVHRQRKAKELLMFHVRTKGGKNVVKIMRNPALKTDIQEITVYAYKGEKVKEALKRDGRLQDTVFKKNCALSHTSTDETTEMSNLVDDLDGKTFKIILLNKCSPPNSQPGSLDDAYMMQNESQVSDCNGNQDPPQQTTTTESVNDNTPKKNPKLNGNMARENILHEIPNSKKMLVHLSNKFQDLVKGMKTQRGSKLSRIQNLFRVEFGKNAQTCREVKTMKKLMDLSNSVCQVRINGRPEGSGFLLFDKFVLTNAHVIKNIYDMSTWQLNERVTVHFAFESLDHVGSGAAVEEVAGFEYCTDVSGHMCDWALLRLGADQKLPDGLLTVTRFSSLPHTGGICIIGHPYDGVKKIDPCLIVPIENRNQVVERHHRENPEGVLPLNSHYRNNQETIQMVTERFFDDVVKDESNRQALNYESCFYFGSSGSPVFDEHCNIVAMHTGGYSYHDARGQIQSILEYGYPLSVIIEHIIIQLVERGRFDVLREYLACFNPHHQNMMTSLKRLVESRNLTAFKNAANNSVATNEESLKMFFQFFSQQEEPVPMDTD